VAKLKPDFSIPGITTIPIPLKNGMVSMGSFLSKRITRSLGVSSAIVVLLSKIDLSQLNVLLAVGH
jgi:hypothetical protein